MKILLIPPYDWLEHPYVPTRYTHIFQRIAQQDEVHVLRFRFGGERKLKTNIIIHEMNEIQTVNLALYYLINANKHFRMVGKIVNENDIDIVISSNLLASYIAAKAVGNRSDIVFDLCDHFPTSATGYYFNVQSVLGKMVTCSMEKLLKRNLASARHVVTSSYMLRYYVKMLGLRCPISTIHNGVNESFLENNYDETVIREKYDLDNSLVIGYVGSIEFWLDMFPLLSAIKRLKRKYDVKLLIVGSRLRTNAFQEIYKQLRKLQIEDKVVWLERFVPHHEVPFWISAMDICTIPFNHKHPTAYYSAPIKLFEYLALQKPVLSTPVPEVLIVAKDWVNVVVTEDDYAREIESYIKDPTSYLEKGKQGKLIAGRFTWTKVTQCYRKLLMEIAEGS